MYQSRKNYRKNFSSLGQILLGGEELDFINYNVSVNGIQMELLPGELITEISDVVALKEDNAVAEVYVEDLHLSGEAKIIWARVSDGKMMLGLEFKEVVHNTSKAWRKRKFYRKNKTSSGHLFIGMQKVEFKCRNISADGMVIFTETALNIVAGNAVKIISIPLKIKALATVIWTKKEIENNVEYVVLGLRYLKVE